MEGQERNLVPYGGPYCYLHSLPRCGLHLYRFPEAPTTSGHPVQIPLGCSRRVAGTLPEGMSHQLAAARVSGRRWAGPAARSPPWQVSSWKTTQLVSGVDHSVPDWTSTGHFPRGRGLPGAWILGLDATPPPSPHVISFGCGRKRHRQGHWTAAGEGSHSPQEHTGFKQGGQSTCGRRAREEAERPTPRAVAQMGRAPWLKSLSILLRPGKPLVTGACCPCSLWGSAPGFTHPSTQVWGPTGFCPHSPKVTHRSHSDSLCPSDTDG